MKRALAAARKRHAHLLAQSSLRNRILLEWHRPETKRRLTARCGTLAKVNRNDDIPRLVQVRQTLEA
jgi:hypothetical protein